MKCFGCGKIFGLNDDCIYVLEWDSDGTALVTAGAIADPSGFDPPPQPVEIWCSEGCIDKHPAITLSLSTPEQLASETALQVQQLNQHPQSAKARGQ